MRSTHRHRPQRGGYQGENNIIEESTEDGAEDEEAAAAAARRHDEEAFEGADRDLDESTWQVSPTKTLSRENSGAQGESEVGVLGLMYQSQQAHIHHFFLLHLNVLLKIDGLLH